ncbi:HD domain-containing phosphohydrolase [Marinitoga aeolica]|uniref:Transporter substrate-binding domain-containing protein n=1 Tax=Marinitoga aeolica TaxID=2809031 RepID=A0ABY8PSV4_9BACT|nr:HD domain-containing phosphohydrolase [Marinitoga aeolica]WGS65697.1 transporter substrate-binding domain-containing protein [Marinitoga aeolica]
MKKFIIILIIIIIPIFSLSITIGLYKAPPIVIDENTGFLNEILNFIAKKNNIPLNFVIDSQVNLIEKLKKGQIDAVAPLGYTDKRALNFYFNKEPVFFEWAVVYTRYNLHLNSLLDLKGLKIGVMKTDIFYEGNNGIKDILNSFKIKAKFIEFNSYSNIFESLNQKKIDAGVVPRFFGLDQEKNYKVNKTSIIFKPIGGFIMYRKDSNLKNIFDIFDKYIINLKENNNSFYYKTFDKYFEPVIREKIPLWLKISTIFGIISASGIIILFYFYSKLLKKKVYKRTESLKNALSELETKITELNNSKKLIEEIVNLSPNPIYIKNIEQKIIFANNALASLLGIKKDDLIGKNLLEIFDNSNKKLLEDSIIEDIEIISDEKKGYVDNFKLLLNDKVLYFKDYKTSITLNNNEKGLLVLWVDITEIIKYQKELEQKNKELLDANKKLEEIINLIYNLEEKNIDIEMYFDYLLKNALKIVKKADYGSISIGKENKWQFLSAVGHNINILKSLPLEKKYMVQTQEKIQIFKNDELKKFNENNFEKNLLKEFFKAVKSTKETMLATAYINKNIILNFSLDIAENSPESFNNEDKKIFQSFINLAKSVLSKKLNVDKVKNAYLNFANKLALIAEAHDDITGQHIYRVGELASFVAKKLNIPDEKILEIREFAPLHDIGKIFVPLEILNKKTRLTDEEFEIMKKHTIYAEKLLGDDPYFETALKIALYHHEKYNGGGYPFNLKGDQIPIEAQIVSLVDVYDALRSNRPYKKAFSHEKTLKIILNGDDRTSPENFNPKLLEILKMYSTDIKDIYNTFSD